MGIKILDLYSWVGKRCPTPYAYNCDIQTMKKGDPCQVHFDNRLADGPSNKYGRSGNGPSSSDALASSHSDLL